MNEKLREEIISAVDKSIKIMGAKDYETGMEQASNFFAYFYEGVESIKTPDDLRALLDGLPSMSKREEIVYRILAQNIPHLVRLGFKAVAKQAAKDLPALGGGRPNALSGKEASEALDYVSKLERMGCRPEAARSRAANKYGCSVRTIKRLWSQRASFSDDETEQEVSLDEALHHLVANQEPGGEPHLPI